MRHGKLRDVLAGSSIDKAASASTSSSREFAVAARQRTTTISHSIGMEGANGNEESIPEEDRPFHKLILAASLPLPPHNTPLSPTPLTHPRPPETLPLTLLQDSPAPAPTASPPAAPSAAATEPFPCALKDSSHPWLGMVEPAAAEHPFLCARKDSKAVLWGRVLGGGSYGLGKRAVGKGRYGGVGVALPVLFACCGGLSFGYHVSVINASLPFLLADLHQPATSMAASLVVSIPLALAAVGAPLGGWLADVAGRRRAFQIASLPFIAGSLLSAAASATWQMVIGRALVGVGLGIVSGTVPLYISEVTPTSSRGTWGTLAQLSTSVGVFSALLVGLPLEQHHSWWRPMFLLGSIPPCLLLLGMAVAAPETPRWLLLHHSLHAAARAAVILRGTEGAEEVLQELLSTHPLATSALTSAAAPSSTALHLTSSCSAVEVPRKHSAAHAPSSTALHSTRSFSAVEVAQKHDADAMSSTALHSPLLTSSRSAPPLAASLFHPRYRRVLLLGPALFALQQFAGINAVVYFSSHVFRSAGFSSGIAASVLIASFKLAAVLLAARLVDSAGRKPLLLLSFLGMGFSMLFLSAVLSWPLLQPHAPLLSIIGTITYVTAFSCGVGPIPSLLLPEIFPLQVRAAGVACSMAVHWVCNFCVGCFFLPATSVVGVSGVYLFFSFVCFMSMAFVYCSVTETKGLSLEEIGDILEAASSLKRKA
ncbi:unnamed protein product [Closterium sp. Yama58-4]|nr:unnamed protein product [Closterium sp. Yama58-4]